MKQSIQRLMSMMVMFSALLFSPEFYAQEVEPNNTVSTANPLTLNGSSSGALAADDGVDYYEVILTQDGNITITVDLGAGINARVQYYNKNASYQSQSGLVNGPGTITYTVNCLRADTVYFNVLRSSGEGTYDIENSFETPTYANDIEPNDNIVSISHLMAEATSTTGHLGYGGVGGTDSQDYFYILPGDDGNITVSAVVDSSLNLSLAYFYKSGTFLQQTGVFTGENSLTRSCVAQDTLVLRVLRSSGCGSYEVTFNTDSPPTFAQDTEPNNNVAQINYLISEGETIGGRMGYTGLNISDNSDYYHILPADDGSISVSAIVDSTLNVNLQYFYKSGTFLQQTGVFTGENSLVRNCVAEDTLVVHVLRSSGCGSYEITFNTDSPPTFAQDAEPNDAISQINYLISEGETIGGRMGYTGLNISDANDYYHILPADDGTISVSAVVDSSLNVNVQYFYKNGTYLQQTGIFTGEDTLVRNCVAVDTLVVRVLLSSGCGSYALTFNTDSPPTFAQDVEPNDNISQINYLISENETIGGRMGYGGLGITDGSDYYHILLEDNGKITVSAVVDSSLNINLQYFYKNGTYLQQTGVFTGLDSLQRTCAAEDTMVVRVVPSFGCGSYELTFKREDYIYADDLEPNNSTGLALPILNGEKKTGHLGQTGLNISDGADFYAFTVVEAPFELDAKVIADPGLNYRIQYFNSAGTYITQTAVLSGAGNFTRTIEAPGTYYLNVLLFSGCGSYEIGDLCGEYPAIPTISADGPLAFCDGGDVNLMSSAEVSYEWNTGATTQSINVTTSGDYVVTVFDVNGCPAESAPTAVTVWPLPDIPTITPDGPTTFCAGEDVTLMSTPEASYLWSTGETTQSITVSTTGDYSVTVTDSNGCSRTSAVTAVVRNPNPAVPTITPDGPTTFCDGGSVTLTSSSANSYLWSTGATTQSIAVSNSGNYSVTVTNANGCSRTSGVTAVTVDPLPATPTITPDGPTTFCETESVTLSSSAEDSYLWNTGATTQSILVTTSGSYSVTVTTVDGCSATSASTSVTVNPNTTWYADTDGDSYGDSENTLEFCTQPAGYVANDLDCDDSDEFINPDSDEICYNAKDDNCDGSIDEGCPDCSVFESAPVDLTKSFDPVNGVQDRVQVKWFKDTPQVRYSDEDAAACDIKFWPKRNLNPDGTVTGPPIVAAPGDTINILNTKKFQPDGVTPREIFKWPVKFRAEGANNNKRAEPNIRYEWQVRCACDHGAGPESPWSVVKIFNTPDFDPSTGIYTPPTGPASGAVKWIGEQNMDIKLYPNPNVGDAINLDLSADIDEVFTIQIVDMTGKVIHLEQINSAKRGVIRIDFYNGALPAGMYTMNLIQTDKMYRSRFIVK